jgi:hypothetical protein
MVRPVSIVSLAFVFAASACQPAGTAAEPPSPATAAPVEKAVRDLIGGYTGAADGDAARAALEAGGAKSFIEALKTKAGACAKASEAGTPDATCDRDPITCAVDEKPAITAVVVTSVAGPKAEATAVLTAEGKPAANVRVRLEDEAAVWKVAGIECP